MKVDAVSESKSKGGGLLWGLLVIFTGGLALLFLPFFLVQNQKLKLTSCVKNVVEKLNAVCLIATTTKYDKLGNLKNSCLFFVKVLDKVINL